MLDLTSLTKLEIKDPSNLSLAINPLKIYRLNQLVLVFHYNQQICLILFIDYSKFT